MSANSNSPQYAERLQAQLQELNTEIAMQFVSWDRVVTLGVLIVGGGLTLALQHRKFPVSLLIASALWLLLGYAIQTNRELFVRAGYKRRLEEEINQDGPAYLEESYVLPVLHGRSVFQRPAIIMIQGLMVLLMMASFAVAVDQLILLTYNVAAGLVAATALAALVHLVAAGVQANQAYRQAYLYAEDGLKNRPAPFSSLFGLEIHGVNGVLASHRKRGSTWERTARLHGISDLTQGEKLAEELRLRGVIHLTFGKYFHTAMGSTDAVSGPNNGAPGLIAVRLDLHSKWRPSGVTKFSGFVLSDFREDDVWIRLLLWRSRGVIRAAWSGVRLGIALAAVERALQRAKDAGP